MKIFALSDFHLSFGTDKPMDLFGDHWTNYENEIKKNWNAAVGDNDIGIIAGDISWAMKESEAEADFAFIRGLKGIKIIVRGNHDYWWKGINKVRDFVNAFPPQPDSAPQKALFPNTVSVPENSIVPNNTPPQKAQPIFALQNDSLKIDDFVFAGSRGWHTPERRQTQTDEDKKIYDREVIRFELSLQDAVKRMDAKSKLIAILHYPPFNCSRDDSPFTRLCEKYKAAAVVYGHLHGKGGRPDLVTVKNGIKYYLTSTDLLSHKPIEIII
jgi:predicted phosphohydrolase